MTASLSTPVSYYTVATYKLNDVPASRNQSCIPISDLSRRPVPVPQTN